jgi:hypothetical protein
MYLRIVECLGISVFDYPIFAEWISFFVCGMFLRARAKDLWKISLVSFAIDYNNPQETSYSLVQTFLLLYSHEEG